MSDSPELTDMNESEQNAQGMYTDPFALFLPALCLDSSPAVSHAAGGDGLNIIGLSFNDCCCFLAAVAC